MFNMSKYKTKIDPTDILKMELGALGVIRKQPRGYRLSIGDETINVETLEECTDLIQEGLTELKNVLWQKWQDLAHLAIVISGSAGENSGDLSNSLFLYAVKKAYYLSTLFSDLNPVQEELRKLLYSDVAFINEDLVRRFNSLYLQVRLTHYLVMYEIYRLKLIGRYLRLSKTAQVSGPWANLDLPMKERVWDWDEEEEYQIERAKAKKNQVRYNPETDKYGFYYVWQDLRRDPYRFTDMRENAPYKSRHLLTVP